MCGENQFRCNVGDANDEDDSSDEDEDNRYNEERNNEDCVGENCTDERAGKSFYCIDGDAVCNGVIDCTDGEDEQSSICGK